MTVALGSGRGKGVRATARHNAHGEHGDRGRGIPTMGDCGRSKGRRRSPAMRDCGRSKGRRRSPAMGDCGRSKGRRSVFSSTVDWKGSRRGRRRSWQFQLTLLHRQK